MLSSSARAYNLRVALGGYTDISLSGPRYGLAPAAPRGGYTDISSSGPNYGVAPPKPPAAPTGGYNFAAALRNDPLLRSYLTGINAQGTALAGNRDAARTSALAQYGAVPDASVLGFNPGSNAYGLANAATQGGVSTTAQLAQAYNRTNADDAAIAGAHGLTHSGYSGQFRQQNLDAYTKQQYDALNALLGQLGTTQSNYLTQEQALQQQAQSATSDALQRQIAMVNAGLVR